MRTTKLGMCLCTLLAAGACSTDDTTITPNDGDAVVPDEELPPFTSGVSTLTGGATAGFADGVRGKAKLSNPVNVAFGPDGKLYVADFDNHRIRRVDVRTGETTTVVAQAGFRKPFGLTFAKDGVLYVTTDDDPTGAHGSTTGTVWRVDLAAKQVSVVVAAIGRPRGIVALPDGRLAVSDYQHHVIQLVDPGSGNVTPLAGTWDAAGMVDAPGAAARFSTPYGIAVRADGSLVVADYGNHRLRSVRLDGTVSTLAGAGVAGFADGAPLNARFDHPQGVAIAGNGDLFFTDIGNFRIRRLKGGVIDTVAGNGTGGYLDSDNKLASQLYGLEGISLAPDGSTLFVADGGRGEPVPYNRIRSIKM